MCPTKKIAGEDGDKGFLQDVLRHSWERIVKQTLQQPAETDQRRLEPASTSHRPEMLADLGSVLGPDWGSSFRRERWEREGPAQVTLTPA